ncbi:uncharacterized protein LOC141841374 [Curcuma longa]|uniref:uncharacterized protein LOC141841374 n=1 Tax=Curcuma longa TaxID=136217 RepID=UPI003D9E9E97
MIDFTAGCFGAHDAAAIVGGGGRRRAVKNTVTCFYVTSLSTKKKEVLIMVTWQRNNGDDTSVVVVVDDEPSSATPFRHAGCNTQILWKKGSRSFFSGDSMFLLHWDISAAKYGPGSSSEPTKDFYLSVAADAELVLLLGDKGKDYVDKFPMAPFSMYGRCERVVVPASAAVHYSTKARFRDGGREHDVSVVCRGERDAKNGELCVSVDRKRAIHVPNVGWNFRGNQAITIDDGSAVVDVLWDVHDWWFRESSGGGGGTTFLFRARSSPESERACWWPEEAPATAAPPPFTLSIQVSKSQ